MKNKRVVDVNIRNIILIGGIVFSSIISIVSALLMGNTIDVIQKENVRKEEILSYLILVLLVLLFSKIFNIIAVKFLPLKLILEKSIRYSEDIMEQVLNLSVPSYQEKEQGYYINMVTTSAFTTGEIYGQINIELFGNIICVAIMTIIAGIISPWLFLIYLVYIPIFYYATKYPNLKISEYQKRGLPTQDAYLTGTKRIIENKRGINISRAEEFFLKRYKEKAGKYLDFITKYRWYSILATNFPQIISSILLIVIMGISIMHYLRGEFSLGVIVGVFQLSQLLQDPLSRCFEILSYKSINDIHIKRLSEFCEKRDRSDTFDEYGNLENLMEIQNTSVFATKGRERRLFTIDNMSIPKKGIILIKGKNGSGKSMFINCLTGYAHKEVCSGNIRADKSVLSAAYLSSPLLLIEGDLEENMFGKEMDKGVCEMLGIDFQEKVVSDTTINLSYGEQQKLSLLRVLSQKTETIILDEPFTNLDKITVEKLIHYLQELKKEKTIIVIDHSSELEAIADQIYEIKNERMELQLI